MDAILAQEVRDRARDACEYCQMPQAVYPTITFPLDHIIARQHGGRTVFGNLALACLHCNAHKGPNLTGIDPVTRKVTRLFNPRRHKWERHFRWDGPYLRGRTAIGRTTVMVLALNDEKLVRVRASLIEEGWFPPG